MTREETYVLAAIRAVVNRTSPPNPPEGLDWETAARLAVKHSVGNLFCYAIEGMDCVPPELLKRLVEYKKKAILREAIQETELSLLRVALNQAKIQFMPLKGILLKQFYPKPDMRMMGDIDILFDETRAEDVREILVGMGYTVKAFANGTSPDVYYKQPIMNLELHRTLLNRPKEWVSSFADAWARANRKNEFEFEMTPEDYYVFLMAHLIKHYVGYGTGIRSILDIWVCKTACAYDREQVLSRFEELGVSEFAKNIENLADAWFGNGTLTPLLEEIGNFVLMSGTYGERLTKIMACTADTGAAKSEYFFRRLFLSRKEMEHGYPILKKAPFLLPVCWLYRLGKKAFRRDVLTREMQLLGNVDGEKASALQDLHKRAGIKESMFED